jgi:hypothetical protein
MAVRAAGRATEPVEPIDEPGLILEPAKYSKVLTPAVGLVTATRWVTLRVRVNMATASGEAAVMLW